MAWLAILLGLGVTAAIAHAFRRKQLNAWLSFAATRQLSFNSGRIAGVQSGFTVAMLVESRGKQEEVAVARCSLEGVFDSDFTLARETVWDKAAQLVGVSDHQLGVPELDRAFLLQNVDDRARHVLQNPLVQMTLLRTVKTYPDMRIGKNVLHLETGSVPTTETDLAVLLDDLLALATALQKAK